MANRIMLNETSYHGAGAIQEIAAEAKARQTFLTKLGLLMKFILTSKQTRPSKMYRMVLPHSKLPKQITLLQLAAVLLWIPQRQSVLSLQIRNLKT